MTFFSRKITNFQVKKKELIYVLNECDKYDFKAADVLFQTSISFYILVGLINLCNLKWNGALKFTIRSQPGVNIICGV